jgi:hypothetical protein
VNLRKDHSHISVIDSRIELVTRFLVFLCSIRGVPVFHDFNSWSRLSACFEWWSRGMGPTLLCVTFLSAFIKYNCTFSNGRLGSQFDEGRSKLR